MLHAADIDVSCLLPALAILLSCYLALPDLSASASVLRLLMVQFPRASCLVWRALQRACVRACARACAHCPRSSRSRSGAGSAVGQGQRTGGIAIVGGSVLFLLLVVVIGC